MMHLITGIDLKSSDSVQRASSLQHCQTSSHRHTFSFFCSLKSRLVVSYLVIIIVFFISASQLTQKCSIIPYLYNSCILIGSYEEGKWPDCHGPAISKSRKYIWQGILLFLYSVPSIATPTMLWEIASCKHGFYWFCHPGINRTNSREKG